MRLKLLTILAVLALGGATANAKDMSGRIGVGADRALGFSNGGSSGSGASFSDSLKIPGLSIVYQTSKLFAIQAILAFNITSSTADGNDASATDMGVAVRGHMQLLEKGDLSVKGVGGLAYGSSAVDDNMGMEVFSSSNIAFEVGVRPEWFVTNHLSFHTQIGITVDLLDEDSGGFESGGINVNLLGASSLLGDAGFTFYF